MPTLSAPSATAFEVFSAVFLAAVAVDLALVFAVLVGSLLLAPESPVAGAQSSEIQPAAETDPVPSGCSAV